MAVKGDVTYTAQFTEASNKVSVTFYDDDGETVLGVAVVEIGGAAAYPNELPTKESTGSTTYTFDKWVTEKGGSTEVDLNSVTENINVYASYKTAARKYTVTFCDWDGTVFETQEVEHGKNAVSPGNPEREGYRFTGWDKSLNNITEDTTFIATYVKQYEVKFVDYNGTVVDVCYVDAGGTATVTEGLSLQRMNYRFIGWDKELINIHSDTVVNAVYVRQYTVEFVNYDGTVIDKQVVDAGANANKPTITPERTGHTFAGWEGDYSDVNSDITIVASFTLNTYSITFLMPDYLEIDNYVIDVQEVKYGFYATTPASLKEIYFDDLDLKGYRFAGWDKSIDLVESDMTVTAIYEEITDPILYMESCTIKRGETSAVIYLYLCNQPSIYGINFEINYDGKLSLTEDSLDVQSNFNEVNKYTVTLNKPDFEGEVGEVGFAWSKGTGVSTSDGYFGVIALEFEMDKRIAVGEYLVEILEGAYFVDEDMSKVQPIIISGSIIVEK